MNENSYESREALMEIREDVGPVVWSCRDRSQQEQMSAVGHRLIGCYFMAFVCPVLLSVMIVAAIVQLLGETIRPIAILGLLGLSYAVICGAGLWWLLRTPKNPSLVLHDRGFRFKRTVVKFDELTVIRPGRPLSAYQLSFLGMNRQGGRFNPICAMLAALLARAWEGCVVLEFKDGRAKTLKGMLIRPQPDDLKQFFARLGTMHPNLVDDPRSSPHAAWLASAMSPSDSRS